MAYHTQKVREGLGGLYPAYVMAMTMSAPFLFAALIAVYILMDWRVAVSLHFGLTLIFGLIGAVLWQCRELQRPERPVITEVSVFTVMALTGAIGILAAMLSG